MVNPFVRLRKSIANLPDKKKYIEVITASLSIPVLLSVVLVNYLNIQDKRSEVTPTPIVTQAPQIITIIKDPVERDDTPTPPSATSPSPIRKDECIKEIGPISIFAPEENETITTNPLEIDIQYDQGDYCSVVWRYRINDTNWSSFTDNNIIIYNMDSGKKTLELQVKSIVSDKSSTLKRTFTYQNSDAKSTPTVTPTPTGAP
ncbi:MAG: hypothetical protein Q8P72_03290 [Candidatus Roizmanbacteria bacterium]|nr:hypothetical protein [Candidatus Roizmanbacteria bacterium]